MCCSQRVHCFTVVCRYDQRRQGGLVVTHQVGSPGGPTKAGVVRGVVQSGWFGTFFGGGGGCRHEECVFKEKGRGALLAHVLVIELGSLRNGLHLFSDL